VVRDVHVLPQSHGARLGADSGGVAGDALVDLRQDRRDAVPATPVGHVTGRHGAPEH